MANESETYRFIPVSADSDLTDLSVNPRFSILAVCIADQQRAGFGSALDLRMHKCPVCEAPGFNSGWGVFRYACSAEILSDGEPGKPCGATAEKGIAA